jgi:iron complex transport system substrate-binding protein
MDASSRQIDLLVRERLKTQKSLYTLDIPTLERLRPDLIVTQSLCDVCAVAESEVQRAACSLPGNPRVINLEPSCLEDMLQCMELVAEAAGCGQSARREIGSLRDRIQLVTDRSAKIRIPCSVMLLEWIDPPFCAGHWSPELVELAGGREVIGHKSQRSQSTTWEAIVASDPDVLFIACCGFGIERTMEDLPILESFPEWNTLRCVLTGSVFVVDGSAYFSRPGPRLVDSLEILANALHPTLHPLPLGLAPALAPYRA